MADEKNTNTEQDDQVNWLEMSDEDLMKAPIPDFTIGADAGNENEDDADKNKDGSEDPDKEEESGGDEDNKTDETGENNEDAGGEGDKAPAAEGKPGAESTDDIEKSEGGDKNKDTDDKKDPKDAKQADTGKAPEIDYADVGKQLLAPFKANGREVQPKSVEDARALMQMGANYNKKMAALKPNLKVLKLLENHGLLDEEKLNFLIDLDRKDPQAITKLVKDAGLNPMDLDTDKAGDYKPQARSVDDREIELDTVLDDLKGSGAYTRTLSVVSKEWDAASRRVIADQPMVLRVLHDHIERGVYDLITKEVENERTFGRLQGLSDIEAYRQVGDAMHERGAFNHLGSSRGNSTTEREVVTPKPKKVDDAQREEKRRAASSNRPASSTGPKVPAEFNPLAMSDDEFEKQAKNHFR